jgi:uncharacterized protein YlbG (UPF0298 family)
MRKDKAKNEVTIIEVTTKRQNQISVLQNKLSEQRTVNESTSVKYVSRKWRNLAFSCDRNNNNNTLSILQQWDGLWNLETNTPL